jgi:GntR family transcriptional regulator/MocR family aminotransferase
VPTATQAIVADFMDEGIFATHVRTMRQLYKERYEALVEAAAGIAHRIDLQATKSGFHAVGFLPGDSNESEIVESTRAAGIVTTALGRYAIAPFPQRGLVLGFGSTPPDDIRQGIAILGRVLDRFV